MPEQGQMKRVSVDAIQSGHCFNPYFQLIVVYWINERENIKIKN